MKRREVLRLGIGLGVAVAAEGVDVTAEAARGPSPARFFAGTLHGGPADGWQLTIGISFSRARGFAFMPGALTADPSTGFVMNGTLTGADLSMTLYSLQFSAPAEVVGTLTGTLKGSGLNGNFMLQAGGQGSFSTRQVKA